jgi:hypothetical protein
MYGIVGAMIGGIAEFKQQNRVRGLPLQLCPEEVTYLLRDVGVIRLYSMDDFSNKVRALKKMAATGHDRQDGDRLKSSSSDDSDGSDSSDSSEEPAGWQSALANGTEFVVHNEGDDSEEERYWDCAWEYPRTAQEKDRCTVFADLKVCFSHGSAYTTLQVCFSLLCSNDCIEEEKIQHHSGFQVWMRLLALPWRPDALPRAVLRERLAD